MTETKTCINCGREFRRHVDEGNFGWQRRTCCSLSCAGARGHLSRQKQFEAKVCPQCGKTFTKPEGMHASEWKRRRYCSLSCGNAAGHKSRKSRVNNRYAAKRCDCGEPTTGIVWILQGDANGRIHAEFVEVCEDCLQMWLEDGATLERPHVPEQQPQVRARDRQPEYYAPAHVSRWHHNGGRPV